MAQLDKPHAPELQDGNGRQQILTPEAAILKVEMNRRKMLHEMQALVPQFETEAQTAFPGNPNIQKLAKHLAQAIALLENYEPVPTFPHENLQALRENIGDGNMDRIIAVYEIIDGQTSGVVRKVKRERTYVTAAGSMDLKNPKKPLLAFLENMSQLTGELFRFLNSSIYAPRKLNLFKPGESAGIPECSHYEQARDFILNLDSELQKIMETPNMDINAAADKFLKLVAAQLYFIYEIIGRELRLQLELYGVFGGVLRLTQPQRAELILDAYTASFFALLYGKRAERFMLGKQGKR